MRPRSLAFALGSAIAGGVLLYVATRQPTGVTTRGSDPKLPMSASSPAPATSPFTPRDRSRDDPPEPSTPPVPVPVPADVVVAGPAEVERRDDPDAPPASAPPLPAASPAQQAATARATEAARAAVGRAHGTMRRECWEPLVDRPNGATIEFSLSYDADGNVIASAVQQTREHYSEALGTCLANHATGLKIEAPGEPVSLSVPVALP